MILGDKLSFDSQAFNDSCIIDLPFSNSFDASKMHFFTRRMHILLLPDITEMASIKREIRELAEAYDYSKSTRNTCMLKLKEKHNNSFEIEKLGLEMKYKQLMKKVQFSGKALVFFRELKDVDQLFMMNLLGKRFQENRLNSIKTPKIFRSNLAKTDKKFLIENKDFLFHNMKVDHKIQTIKEIAVFFFILIIFILASTSNSIIQSLIQLTHEGKFTLTKWNFKSLEISTILAPLLTLAISTLLTLLVDYSASWKHFSMHSNYQNFIFEKSFCFLFINMLLIPAFSLLETNSIYAVFNQTNSKIMNVFNFLRNKGSNSFFPILIIQIGIVNFLINLFLLSDLSSNRFILSLTLSRKRNINNGIHTYSILHSIFVLPINFDFLCLIKKTIAKRRLCPSNTVIITLRIV